MPDRGGCVAPFLAALGMVVFFAACTDCPLAATLIGVEAFGIAGLPWYLIGAAAAYLLTPRLSLYRNSGRARDWPLLSRVPADEDRKERVPARAVLGRASRALLRSRI